MERLGISIVGGLICMVCYWVGIFTEKYLQMKRELNTPKRGK